MKPLNMKHSKGSLVFNHGWDWITRMGNEKVFTAEYAEYAERGGRR